MLPHVFQHHTMTCYQVVQKVLCRVNLFWRHKTDQMTSFDSVSNDQGLVAPKMIEHDFLEHVIYEKQWERDTESDKRGS